MSRVLGLDVGTHRIGVAVSDESGSIAQPLHTLEATSTADLLNKLRKICKTHGIVRIVVGLPLTLSGGNRNESSLRAERLGKHIEKQLQIEVVFFDERFTTAQAERVLIDAGVRRKKRKRVVDKMAASLILQTYLDTQTKTKIDEL